MRCVIDIECDKLNNPEHIWVIVARVVEQVDTRDLKSLGNDRAGSSPAAGTTFIFRNVTEDEKEKERFLRLAQRCEGWIGHNILGYDLPVLCNLIDNFKYLIDNVIDTLVLSKLINYSNPNGHSIEDYGIEFNYPKIKVDYSIFKSYSKELEEYCIRDVEINYLLYQKLAKDIHKPSLDLEQKFQLVVNDLSSNGFFFNKTKAEELLKKVTDDLSVLDKDILEQFPPRKVVIREFTPRATIHGTINRSSVPRSLHSTIADYNIGETYQLTREEAFNPSSHKQIVSVLNNAGWKPTDRTKTHIECERQLNRLKFTRGKDENQEQELRKKLDQLTSTGWKVNETNLATLPANAPKPARTLAKRILLESRRRTLTEWCSLVREDGRIHGKFYGIGAWTHRMAHQQPNTANIPNEYRTDGSKQLLGKEMRALWRAPSRRLLVGVDAEGIQLRIFAHYINDKDFTEAIVNGKKEDKTDPHSLNSSILGCTRAAAKRFIYAWLLGAGIGKLAEILGVDRGQAEESLSRLYERYAGLAHLKSEVIPSDAKRGWFKGLDGRKVVIPGDTVGERKHLAMSGYLQNGEAIIMKKACLRWQDMLKQKDAILVNFVHDEWQVECPNRMSAALTIAKTMSDSLQYVGEELNLSCPLAGSYWNDDKKDYTIGTNWSVTH